jgi:hypothetical protein
MSWVGTAGGGDPIRPGVAYVAADVADYTLNACRTAATCQTADVQYVPPSPIDIGVCRLHDVSRSGWWMLVPVANPVLMLIPGTPGDNEYGPDPKRAMATVA